MAPLFLRLISWKSPCCQSIKIFVKLDFFTNALAVCFVFVYTESNWEQQLIAPEKKWHVGFDSGINVNIKLIGEDFFMISISKIMTPLWFLSFLLYGFRRFREILSDMYVYLFEGLLFHFSNESQIPGLLVDFLNFLFMLPVELGWIILTDSTALMWFFFIVFTTLHIKETATAINVL